MDRFTTNIQQKSAHIVISQPLMFTIWATIPYINVSETYIASPDPAFATFLTVTCSHKVSTAFPTSSVSLSGSVRTGELKQALPRHSPQAGEQLCPCFLQLHQAVLQPTFHLHLTTRRKVFPEQVVCRSSRALEYHLFL